MTTLILTVMKIAAAAYGAGCLAYLIGSSATMAF